MIRLLLPFVLLACSDGGESGDTSSADACGDPDGAGGDTGNIPNVAGDWTSSFATAYWDDNCTASDFNETSEDWIGAFTVKGGYNAYVSDFHDNPDDAFPAAVDPRGGFTMSGEHQHTAGLIYANFSGLVHEDSDGRAKIDGNGFLGLDVDGDKVIDCFGRGSWTAYKSGL